MNKTLLASGAALATVMLGPATVLLGLAALINPAQAACVPTTSTAASTTSGSPAGADAPAETSRVVFPLPAGTWTRTSGYGMRVHPITGERKLHTGVDFAAPALVNRQPAGVNGCSAVPGRQRRSSLHVV